jgi:large subunit ribosomal protein L21e
MGHAAGLRAGTRYAFSRGFKKTGYIPLTTYLRTYKCVWPGYKSGGLYTDSCRVGDIVDVVANGAVQKGLPYKVRRDGTIRRGAMADFSFRSTMARPVSSM